MKSNGTYDWKFSTVGGVTRVNIDNGQDIAHLGELDQKMWTALSCPTNGLAIDPKTLNYIDSNGDGKIHVNEVVAISQWLVSVIKNPDLLFNNDSFIPLEAFNLENAEGKRLHGVAQQILRNLESTKDSISIDDVSDSMAIFAKTRFNGDGVIVERTADDPELQNLISLCKSTIGTAIDRSGEMGVNTEQIETFFSALSDFTTWKEAGEKDKDIIFPFGDNTANAFTAFITIKDKIDDYFMRCKLSVFNSDCAPVLDVTVSRISEISDRNLADCNDEIAKYPIAHVNNEMRLALNTGINPAWTGAFSDLKKNVFDILFPNSEYITEEQWISTKNIFNPYIAWTGAKKGNQVESLGYDTAKKILEQNRKAELLELVAKDKSLESVSNDIDSVGKLLYLYRDFSTLLKNFVTFSDFYSKKKKAVFQAGTLYIDQRSCDLCIKVFDAAKHNTMASLSGMYILYCDCTCKSKNATMSIAAVVTDGDIGNIKVGKNGIFYDRDGLDWDATVTKIIDNPISVRQAFWSPYRKLANFIEEQTNKFAADKDSKVLNNATANISNASVSNGTTDAKAQPFDMSKFLGLFAVIGMALGTIGTFLVQLATGFLKLSWWQMPLIIIAILLIISGPAMLKAALMLRKRNLSPLLNANGWAINAKLLINVRFGQTLTSMVKYPIVKMKDPFGENKAPLWKRILLWLVILCAVACAVYFILPEEKRPFSFGNKTENVVEIKDIENIAE
ncbi:MAG: hypothetical protein ACI358_06825 [Candidatus Limimorpha sp.]